MRSLLPPIAGEIISWGEYFKKSKQDFSESVYITQAREKAKRGNEAWQKRVERKRILQFADPIKSVKS